MIISMFFRGKIRTFDYVSVSYPFSVFQDIKAVGIIEWSLAMGTAGNHSLIPKQFFFTKSCELIGAKITFEHLFLLNLRTVFHINFFHLNVVVGVVVPMEKNTELSGEEKVIIVQEPTDNGLISVGLKILINMVLAFHSIFFYHLFEKILIYSRFYDISWDANLLSFSFL
jgi:hypothetical protein